MEPKSQSLIDCNVRVIVLDKDKKVKQDQWLKNTATKRMTNGIVMFLAGDGESYLRGKWRPNYISFGTTGIDRQPTQPQGLAYVANPSDFENPNPPEGQRTRPHFFSTNLGERSDGFWNPDLGWGTASNPNDPVFQGELVTNINTDSSSDNYSKIIHRIPILSANVTTDDSRNREVGKEGLSSDCIFYGYTSVLWGNQFFNPQSGPSIPRIAISEVGLYEQDSFPITGLNTLMAGFRVPSVDKIIYLDPGEVILVEWRVTIRALAPYEQIITKEG